MHTLCGDYRRRLFRPFEDGGLFRSDPSGDQEMAVLSKDVALSRKPPPISWYKPTMQTRQTLLGPPCFLCGEREFEGVSDSGAPCFCRLCGFVVKPADPRATLERCLAKTPRWLPAEEDR